MRFIQVFFIVLILGLTGCTMFKKDKDNDEEVVDVKPVEEIYNEGMEKLEGKKYKGAIAQFEEIERTYPYSEWASKSQVMSAYAAYKDQEYDDAVLTVDRFVKLHPGNENVPYMYYLKALSSYEQISDVGRDQSLTIAAKQSLEEVIARFPDSEYSRDSQIKLDLVVDHLAGKEMEIGRFYLEKNEYIAAINRFKKVVDVYETTTHVPEALHRLVETYLAMGIKSEAERYGAVLGHNFPGSKWYGFSYELIEGKKVANGEAKTAEKYWLKIPFWKNNK